MMVVRVLYSRVKLQFAYSLPNSDQGPVVKPKFLICAKTSFCVLSFHCSFIISPCAITPMTTNTEEHSIAVFAQSRQTMHTAIAVTKLFPIFSDPIHFLDIIIKKRKLLRHGNFSIPKDNKVLSLLTSEAFKTASVKTMSVTIAWHLNAFKLENWVGFSLSQHVVMVWFIFGSDYLALWLRVGCVLANAIKILECLVHI